MENESIEPVTTADEKEKAWEDLGRPEEKPAEKSVWFAYNVVVSVEGAISTFIYEPNENIVRKATNFDIYTTSRDLVSDIESQILADRVSKIVSANLHHHQTDETSELRERLLSALSDRGIDTPKA